MCALSLFIVSCSLIVVASGSVNETIFKNQIFQLGEICTNYFYYANSILMNNLGSYVDIYSPIFYLALIVSSIAIYYLYGLVFRPLNRVKSLEEIGYIPDGRFSKKERAKHVQKRRVVGDVPPVYPNGWFGVLESMKLNGREPVGVSILGQELVVFRDENGTAHVLDAYCPHMGANLSVGGRVVGDCIVCPFHGWKFRGHDGKCTDVPYSDRVPDIARVKSWTSVELNGWINMWHHAEGIEPNWALPELDEITNGTWQYMGRSEHYINAHIEEIPINGADVAHLKPVHEPFIAAGANLTSMWSKYLSWCQHKWTASWHQLPSPDGHMACMTLTHRLTIFGINLPFVELAVKAHQIGPGIVYLTIDGPVVKGAYIHILTPVEPLVQKLVHNIYLHWTVPNFIAKFFLLGEAIQALGFRNHGSPGTVLFDVHLLMELHVAMMMSNVIDISIRNTIPLKSVIADIEEHHRFMPAYWQIERDIMIWNNKKFQAKPIYSKSAEDSLIARHRRWYSQFYSEHSPRLKCQKDTLDW